MMYPKQQNTSLEAMHRLHGHGEVNVPGFDGGVRVMTLEEQRAKRKKTGMCVTCGVVKTHAPGLWKAWMPDTVEGLVYKGICLKCNTLDAAKMTLGEPITGNPNLTMEMTYQTTAPSNSNEMFHHNVAHLIVRENSELSQSPHSVDGKKLVKPLISTIFPSKKFHRRRATSEEISNTSAGGHSKTYLGNNLSFQSKDSHGQKKSRFISETKDSQLRRRPVEGNIPQTRYSNKTDDSLASQPEKSSVVSGKMHEADITSVDSVKNCKMEISSVDSEKKDEVATENDGSIITRKKADPVHSKQSHALTKKNVEDLRLDDGTGYGFYTGTAEEIFNGTASPGGNMNKEYIPSGRGEMVYDDGHIAKGVWSKGVLKVKIAPDREQYEPRFLSGYSIGDAGHKRDIVKATLAEIAKLHVGDCAWIRRSNGTWSYAIVKYRSDDDDDVSITFQVKGTSTKTVPIKQWVGYIRLSPKPDIHLCYEIGDIGIEEDMLIASKKDTVKSVYNLRVNDAAWVRRSNGSWSYSLVINISEDVDPMITFRINSKRSTKTVQVSKSGGVIRRIRHPERGLSDKEAAAIFKLSSAPISSEGKPAARKQIDRLCTSMRTKPRGVQEIASRGYNEI